jgi:hypothetical protein
MTARRGLLRGLRAGRRSMRILPQILALVLAIACQLGATSAVHLQNPAQDDGNCADGGNTAQGGAGGPSREVIPFKCVDILTCLDGYASPPTFSQCVALGPVTSESIRLDYNAAGPGSKKVKVSVSNLPDHYISINEVFLWVRKARQYLNECRSLMAFGQEKPQRVPNAVGVMDGLCAAYQHPVTGENFCARIQSDKRCQLDDAMSLHAGIATALAFTGYNADPTATEHARRKLCECSCFSDIVDVYTPIFEMWKHYDPEVEVKMSLLQTSTVAGLCTEDVTASLNAKVEESNGAQCGENTVTLRFTPNKRLPEHTVLTVTGLNAHLPASGLSVVGVNVHLARVVSADYTPAQCSQWCSKQGLCESSGSAVDEGCSALPGFMGDSGPVGGKDAIGLITSERCMRWCDKDAVLKVALNSAVDAFTAFSISIDLRNPTYEQTPPTIMVSASGPGIYAPLEAAEASGSTAKVLRAEYSPSFVTFVASEFDFFHKYYDMVQSVWRGNGPGMLNTLNITVQPNVVLLPGARVTLTGLIRGHSDRIATTMNLPPPAVRQIHGFFSALAIESWDAQGGTLVLRVTPGEGGQTSIPVGAETRFALEMLMPAASTGSGAVGDPGKMKLQIQASRAGVGLICQVQPLALTHTVLNSVLMPDTQFVKMIAMQEKCWPGECNVISFTIAVSTELQESPDVSFTISGLRGMEKPSSNTCYNSDICGDTLSSLIPMFDTVDGSNDVNLFASQGTIAKAAYAAWDAVAGTLTFKLAKGAAMEPFHDYSFKVHFRNGYVGIQSDVRIRARFGSVSSGNVPMDVNGAAAIQVCAPGFISKSVRQSYPWPGCSRYNMTLNRWEGDSENNTMTVILRPNVKMMHPSNITITGVTGGIINITMNTADLETLFAFVQNPVGGHIVLGLKAGHPMLAGETYQFSFTFKNPRNAQAAPDIGVGAVSHHNLFTIAETMLNKDTGVPPITGRTSSGEAAALFIAQSAFVIKAIRQSSPYPDARNNITISIAANIALYGRSVVTTAGSYTNGGTRITVSGLNAIADSTSNLAVDEAAGKLKTSAHWSKERGELIFEMADNQTWRTSDAPITATVEIRNPGSCTASPTVMISASATDTICPMPIQPQAMDRDITSIPFTGCAACGTAGGRCNPCVRCDYNCSDRDAMPLKVHAPAFITKSITQNTTWPGATNFITVTLRANIQLTSSSNIYLAGFVGGNWTTGSITLVSNQVTFGTKNWDDTRKRLHLQPTGTVNAGEAAVFTFTLTNPREGQQSPLITIWATNTGSCAAPVEKCIMDTPVNYLAHPLNVHAPAFIVKDIVQSNPYTDGCATSGRINHITVTFATNFAMMRPARITVSGLMGSLTKDNERFKLHSIPDQLSQEAKWSASTGSLILKLESGVTTQAGTNYTFSFELLNPPSSQSAPPVSISSVNVSAVRMDSPRQTTLAAGDQFPLKIVIPKSQSS